MIELFSPDLYVRDIYGINLEYIKNRNIKGLLVDLDNTLLAWDSFEADERLMSWIEACKAKGFSLCIVSNNKRSRINHCAKILDIPAVVRAIKPRKKAFLKGMEILGTLPKETAVIGDQIFTDILGAKRMGLYAILVRPISNNEFIFTKLVRKLEAVILKKIREKKP